MTRLVVLLFLFLFICLFMIIFFLYQKINRLSAKQEFISSSMQELRNEVQTETEDAKREDVRHHLHMRALHIRDTVYKQTKAPHPRAIEETFAKIGYHPSTLRQLFGSVEAIKMEKFFQSYETYIDKYWKTSKGTIKKVFRGKSTEPYNEYEYIQQASLELLNDLDQTLVIFH